MDSLLLAMSGFSYSRSETLFTALGLAFLLLLTPYHRVRSLEMHCLRLARVGPIRANARAIGRLGSALVVRVELHDPIEVGPEIRTQAG